MTEKFNKILLLIAITTAFVALEVKALPATLAEVSTVYTLAQMHDMKDEYTKSGEISDYWKIEENIPEINDESMLNAENCADVLTRVYEGLTDHFLSLSLHKLALTCHHILKQDKLAQIHEENLITIASIITQSGDGKTLDQALWVTDMSSAYVFLQLADYSLIDAQLSIEDDKVYLLTYIRDKKTFGEYKAFDVTDYFKKFEKVIEEEPEEWKSVINLILSSQLDGYESIIALAIGGLSEAQILLADTLMENVNNFYGLYPSILWLYKMAADQGSAIAQHSYARRVFIDQLEDRYAEAHAYLTDAIEQRYYAAFVLAIIVHEKGLGIKTDDNTIKDLITLASLEIDTPGVLEYEIAKSYRNNKQWDNQILAHKYFLKSSEKGYHWGTANVGDDYRFGHGVKVNHKEAFKWYQKGINDNDPQNGYLKTSYAYLHGIGTKKDLKKSFELSQKAAELGSSVGMTNVGLFYYYSKYQQIDFKTAKQWFEKAAEQNHKQALLHLGFIHYFGDGVKVDYEQAKSYFEQSVDSDYFSPNLMLGIMAEKGQGMPKDKTLAIDYYKKSIKVKNNVYATTNIELIDVANHEPMHDNEDHQQALEDKVKSKDPIAMYQSSQLEPLSLFSNNRNSKKLIKKSAKKGFEFAYLKMAKDFWLFGNSRNKAIKHYKTAYEMGNAEAASVLAGVYFAKDKIEAGLEALQFAVDKDHPQATYDLAMLYEFGKHVEKNLDKAMTLYKKALDLKFDLAAYRMVTQYLKTDVNTDDAEVDKAVAVLKKLVEESNYKVANRNLGEIYINPKFELFDIEQGLQWLVKAAKQSDGQSSLTIAKTYFHGKLVDQDYNIARFFFKDSASKNIKQARFWLGRMAELGLGDEVDHELAKTYYENSLNSKRKKETQNNLVVLTCQKHISAKKGFKPYKTLESLSKESRTALFNLAWSNEHGTCRRKNKKNAKKYYLKAAEQGSTHALYRMYQLHDQGILFEKDQQKAQEYLAKASTAAAKIQQPALMTTFMDLPFDELLTQQ